MSQIRRTPSRRHRSLTFAAVAASCALVALSGCGDDGDDTATSNKKATTTSSTTTSSTTAPADGDAGEAATSWSATAGPHQERIGETFPFSCTPGGQPHSVWGAGTYTADSSVCTAAVQVGLITFAKGGDVTIKIAAGQDSYDGGRANGVTSVRYGSFGGSFVFPDAPPDSVEFEVDPAAWSVNATQLGIAEGETATLKCGSGGTPGSIWGTDEYTGDSSVCTAGAHQGVITVKDGGSVTVKLTPGRDSYEGSTDNGITSSSYGSFDSSFVVVS
ncbi:MAG TPA: LCCL domain-containing protein [Microthrixaceae bacterium]|nr:LCCL domain-containing protein [Microthrixaceae bacterium]